MSHNTDLTSIKKKKKKERKSEDCKGRTLNYDTELNKSSASVIQSYGANSIY